MGSGTLFAGLLHYHFRDGSILKQGGLAAFDLAASERGLFEGHDWIERDKDEMSNTGKRETGKRASDSKNDRLAASLKANLYKRKALLRTRQAQVGEENRSSAERDAASCDQVMPSSEDPS